MKPYLGSRRTTRLQMRPLSDKEFHEYVVAFLGGLSLEPKLERTVRDHLLEIAHRLEQEFKEAE